jgi:hypothetical protein
VVADVLPRDDDALPRHHVVIAGTGRAGTSFIVRFLAECGLDTGMPSEFDARAQAGHEQHLLNRDAPYVVKDPWLFAYCEGIDPGEVAIDALLVPVRELLASATSRILQERISMAEGPWLDWPLSDTNGVVTAGAVYSLDPVDQARILAVGFHRLIHWATVQQIPLFLLEFPRIVDDGEYLLESLWPWLGHHCEKADARAAFEAVADPRLVRVGSPDVADGPDRASIQTASVDRQAMVMLVKERDANLKTANGQLAETRDALLESQARQAAAATELIEIQGRLAGAERQLSEAKGSISARDVALYESQRHLDAATKEISALRGTLSWRVTRPLRRVRTLFPLKRSQE